MGEIRRARKNESVQSVYASVYVKIGIGIIAHLKARVVQMIDDFGFMDVGRRNVMTVLVRRRRRKTSRRRGQAGVEWRTRGIGGVAIAVAGTRADFDTVGGGGTVGEDMGKGCHIFKERGIDFKDTVWMNTQRWWW